jgi:hypothetical protein
MPSSVSVASADAISIFWTPGPCYASTGWRTTALGANGARGSTSTARAAGGKSRSAAANQSRKYGLWERSEKRVFCKLVGAVV